MKERPILFNGEMVRANLSGRKTQTRRVIKPQPYDKLDNWRGDNTPCVFISTNTGPDKRICPYGGPGDRLWVRESFSSGAADYNKISTKRRRLLYKADHPNHKGLMAQWRPSIFMPRWASRTTLEIIRVWVERIKDINEADAKAEGVQPYEVEHQNTAGRLLPSSRLYVRQFRALWNSINAKRGYGWDVNPWVWGIEFKELKG